jgi:thiamine-monophosphate kinase
MSDRISDIGEFGIIGRINDLLKKEGFLSERVTLGIGDDTASFLPRPGFELLVTCDTLVEGRHYLPESISFFDLGRRAMVQNISDIGAMGGRPLYALISLGLKPEIGVRDIEEMYRGFLRELNSLEAAIIGGNLTRTANGLFIDITLIGEVEQGMAVHRSGAKPGDCILVSGFPGQSAAGLHLLLQGQNNPRILSHPLVRRYNTPSHRALLGRAIGQSGLATAMIDISDGFLGDLGHICTESRVGAELFKQKLPLSRDLLRAAAELHRDPYDLFFGASDDYELIITCQPQNASLLQAVSKEHCPDPLREVGRINDLPGGITLQSDTDGDRPLVSSGWDHFR